MLISCAWSGTSTSNVMLNSPFCDFSSDIRSRSSCLLAKSPKKLVKIKARVADGGTNQPPSKGRSPLVAVLEVPNVIWRRTLQPLSNFGFGERSIWEGGVGLFGVSGVFLVILSLVWLRGFHLRSRLRKYQAIFEFSQACGICVGTPVRIRGVTIGNVVNVNSSLRCIDAVVEVEDDKTIIPRNSIVEVNQSGLLMETLIDITPTDPLPTPSVGPCDPDCHTEGLIVCDRDKIKGHQGEAQPLLAKVETLTQDISPLIADIRDSAVLKDVEVLTKNLAEAIQELRRLRTSILTPENVELFRQSVFTLVYTLKNLESISSDISVFTSDEATRQNIKMLIKSLSRML
ncbi:hypothetical protein HPP92_018143 [Vanilla planifolia]|uniref:Mce/MlaD domain-containing protein n=1 Tax=Vanilla planifolia TaxID=51239 RepID=A0A835QCY4_VANPL|nr:hypothetical protein HPP92_018143 [Vanilla planifolia]